jgi:hypothetical protein
MARHAIKEIETRSDGTLGIVLIGLWMSEINDGPVVQKSCQRPCQIGRNLFTALPTVGDDSLQVFRIEPRGQRCQLRKSTG